MTLAVSDSFLITFDIIMPFLEHLNNGTLRIVRHDIYTVNDLFRMISPRKYPVVHCTLLEHGLHLDECCRSIATHHMLLTNVDIGLSCLCAACCFRFAFHHSST